jgi:hypothetical protein
MQSWISCFEQHAMFLETVVQLEQETGDRVSLLQEAIHRSSQAALAYRRGWGSVVVKTLRYKSEGPGIDSRCRRSFFRGI